MEEDRLLLLVEKLSEEVEVEKLERLLYMLIKLVEDEKLMKALELVESLIDGITLLSEMYDENLQSRIENLIEAVAPCALNMDRKVGVISEAAAQALSESLNYEPVGLRDLLGALRDPNVQKTLGFLVKFAKEFGKRI
ncbi:DUF1641 domain-containing protein [Ferroglobus sp.]|uniref:DUF1641 domain-containing protein n=1 Tax=Ferroglobus sp. TaxID=2614230 RepID=UPI0025C3FBE9|nr:DUF1641 domain-containing protein [Ferroglobus sp.]